MKFGVDPTAPDLHLGHTVALTKLRQFQDLGHHGDLPDRRLHRHDRRSDRQVGDAQAADARAGARPTRRPIRSRCSRSSIRERTEVRFNSEWMDRMPAADVVRLCAHYTVARMLERDDFAKRYREERADRHPRVPLPAGAGVRLGGLARRRRARRHRSDASTCWSAASCRRHTARRRRWCVTLPLLEGTDGVQKMSKSLGNYIGVAEPPAEIFGKLMSISDALMLRYYELLTSEDVSGIARRRSSPGALHPMEAKKRLAQRIVARFYGEDDGARERDELRAAFPASRAAGGRPDLRVARGSVVGAALAAGHDGVRPGKLAERSPAAHSARGGAGERATDQRHRPSHSTNAGSVRDPGGVAAHPVHSVCDRRRALTASPFPALASARQAGVQPLHIEERYMAKKKPTSRKGQPTQVLSRLQTNMKQLQRDAETLLSRTRRQAAQLVSRDQKRALERLIKQAQKLRGDLEKRAQQVTKDVESRAEQLVSTIEKQAAKRLNPLLRRLDLPSRQEVHTLQRRVAQLEKRLAARPARPAPKAAAATPPQSLPEPPSAPTVE